MFSRKRRPVLKEAVFEARASAANRKVMTGQYRAACGPQAVLPVAARMGSPAQDASMVTFRAEGDSGAVSYEYTSRAKQIFGARYVTAENRFSQPPL